MKRFLVSDPMHWEKLDAKLAAFVRHCYDLSSNVQTSVSLQTQSSVTVEKRKTLEQCGLSITSVFGALVVGDVAVGNIPALSDLTFVIKIKTLWHASLHVQR